MHINSRVILIRANNLSFERFFSQFKALIFSNHAIQYDCLIICRESIFLFCFVFLQKGFFISIIIIIIIILPEIKDDEFSFSLVKYKQILLLFKLFKVIKFEEFYYFIDFLHYYNINKRWLIKQLKEPISSLFFIREVNLNSALKS